MHSNLRAKISGIFDFANNVSSDHAHQCLHSIRGNNPAVHLIHRGTTGFLIAIGPPSDTFSFYNDDNLSVIFFGEFYRNSDPQSVNTLSSSPQTVSYASLLAASYTKHGINGIFDFDGFFCTILFDKRHRTLLLFRDSSSFKSLFYHYHPHLGLSFSTELDDIFSLTGLSKTISQSGLHEYLRTFTIYPPNTIYKDVFSLKPGCAVVYSGYIPSLHAAPSTLIIDSRNRTFEDCIEEFDKRLTESVRLQTNNYTDKTFFLSGGLDSTLLCAIGRKQIGKDLHAFTIEPDSTKPKETRKAEAIANYLGIKHTSLVLQHDDILKYFNTMVNSSEQPFADPAGIPTFFGFDNVIHYAGAVIDGTGADSLIGIMPTRYKRIGLLYTSRLPLPIRHLCVRVFRQLKPFSRFVPEFDFDEPLDLLIMWKAWRTREIEQLCGSKVTFDANILYETYKNTPRKNIFELYSAMYRLASDDRIHQAGKVYGLNVRFPYRDRHVQSFGHGLPRDFRYKSGEQKRILKAVLSRYIPRSVMDLEVNSFMFPIDNFMFVNRYYIIHTLLERLSLERQGLFNPKLVASLADRFFSGDSTVRFKIWSLIIFQAWYHAHFQN